MNDLEIRSAGPGDREGILDVAGSALGWEVDKRRPALFAWKHDENPLGPSPSWVACDGDRIVGFRTFLRWRFVAPDGEWLSAVRAVDTATHPDYQGRGIFRKLTLGALPELEDDGVGFVFNTPNAQSRPGYLAMGWTDLGRLPVLVAPGSPASLLRMLRSRCPAETWSTATAVGEPAPEWLDSCRSTVEHLLADQPVARGLVTHRTFTHLRWRYGFEPLHYRIVTRGNNPDEGFAVFRVRRRGEATEAVVVDVLVPGGSMSAEEHLVRRIRAKPGIDYAIRIDSRPVSLAPALRVPRLGPQLVWRRVGYGGPEPDLRLRLGDVELF